MRPYFAVLLFALAFPGHWPEAQARDFLGLRPGMDADEAFRLLSKHGKVEKVQMPTGSTTYFFDKYAVSLCPGSNVVQNIDHYLNTNFSTFFQRVKSEESTSGRGIYNIFADEENNAFQAMEIRWSNVSLEIYSVNYTSFGSSSRVSEILEKEC